MNAIAEETFCPETRSAEAWNAAQDRVEAYLLAHRIGDWRKRFELTRRILGRAADRQKADPGLNPTEAAMEEAEVMMDDWFADFLPPNRSGPELARSSMVMRPIDLGPITEAAGETLKHIDRWPYLRMTVVALLVVGTLAVIL